MPNSAVIMRRFVLRSTFQASSFLFIFYCWLQTDACRGEFLFLGVLLGALLALTFTFRLKQAKNWKQKS